MNNKRQSSRRRTFKGGSISFDRGVNDCVIRNMSDTGALLEVASPLGIPDRFILIIKPEIIQRQCQVVRRTAKNIGVKFL